MTFQEFCDNLEAKIIASYESGVTLDAAERLASEFLAAQLRVNSELKNRDLDARMKKSGLKAIRAAAYLDAATKDAKKPSDVMLQAIVDTNDVVKIEQDKLDASEVTKGELERYYSIFQNAHIFFRGVAKGSFGG